MDFADQNDSRSSQSLITQCRREAEQFRHEVERFQYEVLIARRTADELVQSSRAALAWANRMLVRIDIHE